MTRSLTSTPTTRMQSHRRATLVGIGALIVLSLAPIIGHHVSPFETGDLLAGVDHLGALCLTALHLLFTPVHPAIHLALAAGVLYAGWDRFRAWRIVRRSLGVIEIARAQRGDAFWKAATAGGVDPRLLRVVPGLPSPAFTAGIIRPRIYISAALADHLGAAELAAVIAHEGAHAARRDPLRLALFRMLACMLFWLPALRRLAEDVRDQAELLADDAAAGDQPLVLASAILGVARWPSGITHRPHGPREFAGAAAAGAPAGVGFNRACMVESRVRRLAGEAAPVRTHLTRRSLLGAAVALAVIWTSVLLSTHPLPAHVADVHARHCEHQRETALTHLFCLGPPFGAMAADCPHKDG